MKISKKLKRLLLISFLGLYSAGTTYWLTKLFLRQRDEFGDHPHILERFIGPIHLIAALFFIFVMGIIWTRHVSLALKVKHQRISGYLFFAFLGMLALSGITILYGNESLVKLGEQLHPWFGITLLPLLLFHWKYKYRTKRRFNKK